MGERQEKEKAVVEAEIREGGEGGRADGDFRESGFGGLEEGGGGGNGVKG